MSNPPICNAVWFIVVFVFVFVFVLLLVVAHFESSDTFVIVLFSLRNSDLTFIEIGTIVSVFSIVVVVTGAATLRVIAFSLPLFWLIVIMFG